MHTMGSMIDVGIIFSVAEFGDQPWSLEFHTKWHYASLPGVKKPSRMGEFKYCLKEPVTP